METDLARTVIVMPTPSGGTAAAECRDVDTTDRSAFVLDEDDTPAPWPSGRNALLACALPLLNAIRELRTLTTGPDLELLRQRLSEGVRRFDERATNAGVAPKQVVAARYVLCTALDEAIATAPWASRGEWSRRTLLVAFHDEAYGGEKVYRLVARLAEEPRANVDLLELVHATMALGFRGRLRDEPAQADLWRERIAKLVDEMRGPMARAISPAWQPAALPRERALGDVPLWAAIALLGFLLVALHLGMSSALNRESDPVYARIVSLRAAAETGPRPAVGQVRGPRLATLLADEIGAGRVGIREDSRSSTVVLRGDALFASGEAIAAPTWEPVLRRIAEALKAVEGDIVVIGHTDDQPIASLRYPSNWHLSRARARAVLFLLVEHGVPVGRLDAEGRGDAEPLTLNDSVAGRARNRRVEIVVRPPRQGGGA